MKRYLFLYAVCATALLVYGYRRHRAEVSRLGQNQTALAAEVERYRNRLGEAAASAQALRLRCAEYEELRAADAERIANDASRRNALESLGLTVVTATWRHVTNYKEYNRFARILAKHLRTRIRPNCPDYPNRQLALRSELLR